MNQVLHAIIISFLFLAQSCNKDEETDQNSGGVHFSQISGSAYIGCEIEPHFLSLDSLLMCSVALPLDSMDSENWETGCTMEELSVDSVNAHLVLTYLQEGQMELTPLTQDIDILPTVVVLAGDTIDSEQFPFYGAVLVSYSGSSLQMFMKNRYIGGCFHDELFWRTIP